MSPVGSLIMLCEAAIYFNARKEIITVPKGTLGIVRREFVLVESRELRWRVEWLDIDNLDLRTYAIRPSKVTIVEPA